jgi:PAS domain S-box-containing protein
MLQHLAGKWDRNDARIRRKRGRRVRREQAAGLAMDCHWSPQTAPHAPSQLRCNHIRPQRHQKVLLDRSATSRYARPTILGPSQMSSFLRPDPHDVVDAVASGADLSALQQEVKRLREMLDLNSDWIWEVDAAGRYTYVSAHCITLLGYEPAEMIGHPPFAFMPNDEAAKVGAAFAKIVAEKRAFSHLLNRNRCRDGRIVVLETSGIPLLDIDGNLLGYRGIDRDVTEREAAAERLRYSEEGWRDAAQRADEALSKLRETQDDLIRAEKLASLGELVAGVSHEISTPLGIALTTSTQVEADSAQFVKLVDENNLSRSRLLQYASRMREGARLLATNLMRASDLLYSFKQLAADQILEERREIDLGLWIEELLKSLRALARPGQHKVVALCPSDTILDTFPGILAQVITNGVKNGIDHGLFGRLGGSVTINVTPSVEHLTIDVIDDGAGIQPDHLGRVFDPFFTTARTRGGTGLGLHIVHNLVVNRLGGSVAMHSLVGEGSRLRIQLPRRLG